MSWLQTLDAALFRFVNLTLSHPLLDAVMPFFAWNPFFVPAVAVLAGGLIWKGGRRGRLFVVLLLVLVALGDMLVINTIKQVVGRPRPFHDILDAHLLVGKGHSASLPSSHAASWFAATFLAFVYYRRSLWLMLPLAGTVAFSRIYVGVHYPSDVVAGAVLGAGYAATGLWTLNALWQKFGPGWWPDFWARLPSLVAPERTSAPAPVPSSTVSPRSEPITGPQYLRLGYVVIAVILLARLMYLASGKIELSEDEAYQWLWSKHLALSYFSKPPLIAYLQFLGTSLWGDTAFGVRFLSPVIAAILSWLLLRFIARTVSAQAGFWLVLVMSCTPLLAVGATLMTIDPPLVLFWTAAMIAGWRAVQPDSRTTDWLWVGAWMGLGFLSKYSAAFQIVCWAVFFALWAPARAQLKRPGPWLALLITALCTLPVIIWNAQHQWITVEHVAFNAGRSDPWRPTARYFWEFVGAQLGLLNPVFFVAMLWAMIAFWRRERRNPLCLYFFSMGAPVFLGYLLFTGYKRVFPNWIAPSIVPLFCLMTVYWWSRWRAGQRAVQGWLMGGLALGFTAVILLHDTNLIGKLTGRTLPPAKDPLRRVRAWSDTARVVGAARQELLAEGKPVFIIGAHYGLVGQISFYLPEAKAAVSATPLVYYQTSEHPQNQFYFWPGYREQRPGQNAIYVREVKAPQAPPENLLGEFESVTDLGLFEIEYRGRVFRTLQLFACRQLR